MSRIPMLFPGRRLSAIHAASQEGPDAMDAEAATRLIVNGVAPPEQILTHVAPEYREQVLIEAQRRIDLPKHSGPDNAWVFAVAEGLIMATAGFLAAQAAPLILGKLGAAAAKAGVTAEVGGFGSKVMGVMSKLGPIAQKAIASIATPEEIAQYEHTGAMPESWKQALEAEGVNPQSVQAHATPVGNGIGPWLGLAAAGVGAFLLMRG